MDEQSIRTGSITTECTASRARGLPSKLTGRRRGKRPASLDPHGVAQLESALWVAYYRREWLRFVWTAMFVIHQVFGLTWPATFRGSWFLMRATQLWAPCDNDPVAARYAMERFYRLVKQQRDWLFDPAEAARLEVEWWRVHRVIQPPGARSEAHVLVDALSALYAYAFGVPDTAVRVAAEQRALAMQYCDQWVRAGCDLESSLIAHKRAALARSYASLAAVLHVP